MKVVIDLQGAQSESRHRGIGRYAKSMALALVEAGSREHDIWIALNGRLGDSIDALRDSFDGLLSPERIVSYSLPGSVAGIAKANGWRRGAAETIRENFLRGLRADWVWHTSLFEGWVDDAVTSTKRLTSPSNQSSTLYDLIPLIRPKEYLVDSNMREWYERKIAHLQQQDLCFAISGWTRHEGISLLGLAEHRIAVATCGVEAIFTPGDQESIASARHRLRLSHGIDGHFLLYVGGFDTRKNVPLLISAFARLSAETRAEYRLVIGGRIGDGELAYLHSLMRSHRVASKEVIFTGQINDAELVELYCNCSLFVFPSLHEGFGLTVLEAMACGAPVLAANASSLPEVVGRDDMLFDPLNVADLTAHMAGALADSGLRRSWSEYGVQRAKQFSWARGAEQMLTAFESHMATAVNKSGRSVHPSSSLRLAYVSPLPPEPSGISDYSAELLPELSKHYEIEVIVHQEKVGDSWIKNNLPVRSVDWFEKNAHRFDRILYQFGNSPFHLHMFDLLQRFPGTVQLHDSFLGGLSYWRSVNAGVAEDYLRRLYASHGYRALLDDQEHGREYSMLNYPITAEIFDSALGVLVHSQYAIEQARHFCGSHVAGWMRKVAFPKLQRSTDKAAARVRLGIPAGTFVVCSFGMLAPTKLNHRLLEAWLGSKLAHESHCRLIFVGENHGGDYGQALVQRIALAGASSFIDITGFAEDDVYRTWLAAADAAVQLRTDSRGETSAAVFDCLGQCLPLIVNAHATFAELPDDCVIKLPDEFVERDLAIALEKLLASDSFRDSLGKRAGQEIAARHSLPLVAQAYRDSIEAFASTHPLAAEIDAIENIAAMAMKSPPASDVWGASLALMRNRTSMHLPRIFLDVSVVARSDLRTGIERVTRNTARELLLSPPDGWRVELVRLVDGHYVYARNFAFVLLGLADIGMPQTSVEPLAGDVFLGLDWVADKVPDQLTLFKDWRNRGVSVYFLLYDLLPVLKPRFFPDGIDTMHSRWLAAIAACADGVIAISKTVADEYRVWLDKNQVQREHSLALGYSHIGANLDRDKAHVDLSEDESTMLETISTRPTVLVVGTIEPRKGQRLALDAFESLWERGNDFNLVIVGKLGWMTEDLGQRISQHNMLNARLFWNQDIGDAFLDRLYKAADVLLVTSEGEGFGLPLIEAAQHAIPIIARDLPVFREIAGPHATYFYSNQPDVLADTIIEWFAGHARGETLESTQIPWLSWSDSARNLAKMLLSKTALGWLAPWCKTHDPGISVPAAGLRLIPNSDASVSFNDWGNSESWGRWALGHRPRVKMRIVDVPTSSDLVINLVADAFVHEKYPSQSFSIHANSRLLGIWSQHIGQLEDLSKPLQWIIPTAALGANGELEVVIVQEQSVSPASLNLSSDTRSLGLAVKELSLHFTDKSVNHFTVQDERSGS